MPFSPKSSAGQAFEHCKGEITNSLHLSSFESFLARTEDEYTFDVHGVVFIAEHFIVSCSFFQSDQERFLTRVTDVQGNHIRDICFDVNSIHHQETLFYPINEKLFIELLNYDGEESLLQMFDLKEVFTKDKKIEAVGLQDLRHNAVEFGYLFYVINNVSISSIKMQGSIAKIKQLNFWNTDSQI